MDVLSDILKSMRVSGSIYFCDDIAAPWVKEFYDLTRAGFHLVRRGRCWVQIEDRVEQLDPGDLIYLGPGVKHVLSSHHPDDAETGATENLLLLCGYCTIEEETLSPLKGIFPRQTIVREEELHEHPWLKATFDQLSAEYRSQNPGNEILVNKLTEVILVELIRINFGRRKDDSFLNALSDKRISKALRLLHESPESPWTLEVLAKQIGLSRAAFAKRFRELVGATMFAYLSELRVQKAKEVLKTTALPVDDIALQFGYESERAFSKTFSKYVGMTPKQYRKA